MSSESSRRARRTEQRMRGVHPRALDFDQEDEADEADEDAPAAGAAAAPPLPDAPTRGGPRVAYMTPEQGPFRCAHCEHYSGADAERAAGRCDHPLVVAAPDLRGRVEGGGCCDLYDPRKE